MKTFKVLEASVVNILPSTMDLIEDSSLGVTSMAGPYGAFLAVLDDQKLERQLIHEVDLYPILDMAREQGCYWVYFYRDAEPLDGIDQFETEWNSMGGLV